MFSFWPSFGLLVFFLVIFLECRAIAGRVTLPLGSFLMVFCFGAIGAPLLALLLQQIPIFADASAWLIGPPIEELAKALPVIVLAFLTRESRRLSIADLTLIGFASGAGFGFVEANLNAIANGALPSVEYLAAFGLQTDNGIVFFAGHPVTTALVGLAAGIGLRFLPPNIVYAWVPAAVVMAWTSFDHGIYNWKLLNAADGDVLPTAQFAVEFLHGLTLKGQLATWLLPTGLIAAQLIEAYLCSKAVGIRRDLLLAREWRPWVANEWLVALLRARLGRAVFGQTLAYFRLRRAYYLAAFETRRDPKDPTLARHARSLEDRLKRERSMLFDPAPGTWLLPVVVLKGYALQWAWRMRWVLLFAVLVLLLFMLDPASLPEGLRKFLFGDVFTIVVVTAGLAFAVWRIILFGRVPAPDPLAAEGTAFAGHYTRQLLLACSLACGLFPSLAALLGWKALLPGAAFIGGYLPGWIGQGGNLQILLGLGAIGGAVAPDPRPAGEAFRHEIAAGKERIRRLGSEIEGAAPLQLDSFLDAMAKLDAERDAQARRQLALDGCEREASEATIRDPAPVVQSIKDEFDRLAGELLETAAKDLDAMASLEQAYAAAWSEIMEDLDAHDRLRRRLRTALRQAWQAQNDISWALRVVEGTDDVLLPMQLTLLPELREVATASLTARTEIVAAAVERIRATAAEYGENDPFGFAGTDPVEDDAALLAEFDPSVPSADETKPFGLRAAHPAEALAKDEPDQPASIPEPPRGQHYQQALDQLIEATSRDNRYLETIRHLERSDEALQQPIESRTTSTETRAPHADDSPAVAEHQSDLEDLINAIKRDSGYVDFAKDAHVARAPENRGKPKLADKTADDANKAREDETLKQGAADARKTALPDVERQEQEKAVFGRRPAPVISESVGAPAEPQAEVAAVSEVIDNQWAIAAAAYKQTQAQPAAPSVKDAAAQETPIEPPQAAVASSPAEPIEHGVETEGPAPAIDTARSEPARPAEAEAPAESAIPVLPDAPTELAQVEAASPHEVPIEHLNIEAPAAAIETARAEAPAPTEAETQIAPAQVEAAAFEAEPTGPGEIEATAAALDIAQPEASPSEGTREPEHQQIEPATSSATVAERAEAPAAEEPHQPAPETKKAERGEPTSRTETRPSFFARLFEAALRQSSGPKSTSARRDTSHDKEKKPDAQPPSTTARDHVSAIGTAAENRDAELQKSSNEISTPAVDWLADFAAPSSDGAKVHSDDTPLEKIEWPALSETAPEDVPADKSASAPSIPDDVANAFEAPADDQVAAVLFDGAPAADTNEVVHPVAATPAIDSIKQIESQAPKSDLAAETPPIKAAPDVTEAAQAAPAERPADPENAQAPQAVQSDDQATTASDDTSIKGPKADSADEFESKVDRLSHLLDKLERAMQVATPVPAPKAAEPADQGEAQANEPTIAVQPEPVASHQPLEETPKPAQPEEALTTSETPAPSEKTDRTAALAQAEPTLVVDLDPVAPHRPETAKPEQPDEPFAALADTPAAAVEPTTAVDAQRDAPNALVHEEKPAEIVPSSMSSEPQVPSEALPKPPAPAESQSKPDRLSYLLTKLFEAVNKDSAPKPTKPLPIEVKAAPSETATENITPDHPAASEILDLRGSHPIAEPLDEPASVEPPQERESAKVEEQPEPIAPPAQTQSAVVEPAALDDAALPASDNAEPTERSQPAPAAVATDASPAEPDTIAPDAAPAAAQQASEQPIKPRIRVRSSAPATHFGSRKSPRSPTPLTVDVERKPQAAKRSKKSAHEEMPASTPKRDWKLGSETPRSRDADTAKNAEPTFRMKTGSGALATVETTPAVSAAASTNTPAKYYGPRHVGGADGEAGPHGHAQQHAISLADALADHYTRTGTPQPAMYATDRATLHRIIASGKLDAPRRRGAPWSISGMSRRGEVAIRLKPGSEQYVEFVPSTEIFGQVPHYYPRGVGKGTYHTHVPAEHLEYFDVTARQWAPLRE